MKAVCWHGKSDVRVDIVPDPRIEEPTDAIVKVTSTAICGSDLHLYDGYMPTMEEGDIIGHEPMGEVVEVGSQVEKLMVGDRVVVPFTISCGNCFFCRKGLFSLCDNSNPMNKGLTLKTGQTHVPKHMAPLLMRIEEGETDPSFIITHRLPLEEAPRAYKMFRDKEERCIKVVLKPTGA